MVKRLVLSLLLICVRPFPLNGFGFIFPADVVIFTGLFKMSFYNSSITMLTPSHQKNPQQAPLSYSFSFLHPVHTVSTSSPFFVLTCRVIAYTSLLRGAQSIFIH